MGTPGSGRYTTYLPVVSEKIERLSKLFKGGLKDLYDGAKSNADAAKAAVEAYKQVRDGKGDREIFGTGVSLEYADSPDTTEVKWKAAGDPANPYMPDITSPGPGNTEGTQKDSDPKIETVDIKPNFDPENPSVNTTSPSATSGRLGSVSLGEELIKGKSSVE
jgi:hypothetical protein